MLKALYDYARAHDLVAVPGFKRKAVKGYVLLSATGAFLGIDPAPPEQVYCPDIGSAAQGPTKCNILVEKAKILFEKTDTGEWSPKGQFYLDTLQAGSAHDPLFTVLLQALQTPETWQAIQQALPLHKIKIEQPIGFKIDGKPVESSPNYQTWWEGYRQSVCGASGTQPTAYCFVTGQPTVPVETVPKLKGLMSVGGHTSGDALVCFDKVAFCSYDLKKTHNAAVSESAIVAVNAALESLIAQAPPPLAGARYLHWYRNSIPDELDLFATLEPHKTDETAVSRILSEANSLLTSVRKGERPPDILHNQYYMLSLSGASGRVMVRAWEQGNYEDLYHNITAWFHDLQLVLPSGGGLCKPPKLSALQYRLISAHTSPKDLSKSVDKELSGLTPQIMYAILHNTPLPDTVAARALQYIRAQMIGGTEEERTARTPDPVACQWLKIWYNRKITSQGGTPMEAYQNAENRSIPYFCGCLMAVYAAIQRTANPNRNVSVVERFYAAACTTPSMVFGQLSRLSTHHLAAIENKANTSYYENELREISTYIKDKTPTLLTLPEQAEFAIGYYQQSAAMSSHGH